MRSRWVSATRNSAAPPWPARSDISQYLELVDGRLIVKDPATLPKEALSAIRSLREHVTDRGAFTWTNDPAHGAAIARGKVLLPPKIGGRLGGG